MVLLQLFFLFLGTMNATVYWRSDCSPQYQILSHSSVDAPTIVLLQQSELLYFSTGMSKAHVLCSCCCCFRQSVDCFRSSDTFIAPALESYWGEEGGGCAVVVDPGLNRSSMSLHRCAFVMSFQLGF